MTTPPEQPRDFLTSRGYRPLNRTWAKIEILLGLFAVGCGVLLGDWVVSRSAAEMDWFLAGAALALFVLGGYLALAGHRSHLYQSNNELTACLIDEIRRLKDKGLTDEHPR
jgi:hypothetical protein